MKIHLIQAILIKHSSIPSANWYLLTCFSNISGLHSGVHSVPCSVWSKASQKHSPFRCEKKNILVHWSFIVRPKTSYAHFNRFLVPVDRTVIVLPEQPSFSDSSVKKSSLRELSKVFNNWKMRNSTWYWSE